MKVIRRERIARKRSSAEVLSSVGRSSTGGRFVAYCSIMILTLFAIGCEPENHHEPPVPTDLARRKSAQPRKEQENGDPNLRQIAQQALTELRVNSPNVGMDRFDDFLVLSDGRVVASQAEPGRVAKGVLAGESLELEAEIGRFRVVTDMAWHRTERLFVLDSLERSFHVLSLDGRVLKTFPADTFQRRLCLTPNGTLVSTAFAEPLLLPMDLDGKLLEGIGERFPYQNRDMDFQLNAGELACFGKAVYFGFVHPPLIRSYSLDGRLLWERKLNLPTPAEPDIQRSETSGMSTVRSSYSLATLDLATDSRGNVYVLKSGEDRLSAIRSGSRRIEVLSSEGELIADLLLPKRCHQIQVRGDSLFALSRRPFWFGRIPIELIQPPSNGDQ